jgi:chaperonin GroEL (HSP60 family)
MEDIAILTNGTVLDKEVGLSFDNSTDEVLGSAKKVIITKDGTTIIGGLGDAETIKRRVDQINTQKAVIICFFNLYTNFYRVHRVIMTKKNSRRELLS